MNSVVWAIGDTEEMNTLADAADNAADQGKSTWLTSKDGKRLAAVATVELVEYAIAHGFIES